MPDLNSFKSLNEVLMWLTGSSGGAFLIVAWFVSWIVEKQGFWKKLSGLAKTGIIVGVAAVLGIGSQVLLTRPDIVATVDPYFRPVMYVVTAWLTTQVAHKNDPERMKIK